MSDETPAHNYYRRRSEEMSSDQLTNHRLTNLEEGVRQMTSQIASSHALLGEINTRLAVGGHLIDANDKRIGNLERNQRLVVLGILSSLGLWIWDMIKHIAANAKLPMLCLAVSVGLFVNACIPVTVYAPRDENGLPMTLPVTPVGTIESPAGPLEMKPLYPVSKGDAHPPTFPWGTVGTIALAVLGVGGGGFGLRAASIAAKAKTALQIACSLADQVAVADTDEQVRAAKERAMAEQIKNGVHDLTQSVRHGNS